MLRIASRVRFHSPDDIVGYLAEANDLVTPAMFTPEERAALLPKVVELLATGHVEMEQTQFGVGGMAIPRGR